MERLALAVRKPPDDHLAFVVGDLTLDVLNHRVAQFVRGDDWRSASSHVVGNQHASLAEVLLSECAEGATREDGFHARTLLIEVDAGNTLTASVASQSGRHKACADQQRGKHFLHLDVSRHAVRGHTSDCINRSFRGEAARRV